MTRRKPAVDEAEKPQRRSRAAAAAPYDYVQGTDEDLPQLAWTGEGVPLTPALVEKMSSLVAYGAPIPVVATALGVAGKWRRWSTNARAHELAGVPPGWGEGQSKYLAWYQAMNAANAAMEIRHVTNIAKAGEADWKASAYILERRASKRWHIQHKLELTAKNGDKVEVSTMSTEKLIAMVRGTMPELDVKVTKALPADISDAELMDEEIKQ